MIFVALLVAAELTHIAMTGSPWLLG